MVMRSLGGLLLLHGCVTERDGPRTSRPAATWHGEQRHYAPVAPVSRSARTERSSERSTLPPWIDPGIDFFRLTSPGTTITRS
jgi:hypothetical protein